MSKKYLHHPSSTFLRTNPNARLTLAAHSNPLNTKSNFWLIKEFSKVDIAKLKTRCLPFSSSESTRKCWHAWSSSLSLRSHLPGGYLRQIQPISSEVHACLFCVVATHKNQKTLWDNFYTCVYFSLEVLHVSWQCDKWSQPARLLKSWDIECKKVFQLNILSCVAQCSSL